MASAPLERLRTILTAMPPGSLIPRDWLLEQLPKVSPVPSESTTLVDLTVGDLARLFGKRPSTVRAWVERGDFAGAYKLHGKEWRVPMSAVKAFQDHQRRSKSGRGLSAWRTVKRQTAPIRTEDGREAARQRPPIGNAEA